MSLIRMQRNKNQSQMADKCQIVAGIQTEMNSKRILAQVNN